MMAEQRTKKHLERHGDVERVTYPWSNPDFVWKPKDKLVKYAVEVKSVKGITNGRAGRIWVTKRQWEDVVTFAKQHDALPVMIVELTGGTRSYWMISSSQIGKKMKQSASFTIWQIIKLAERID